LLVIGAGDDVEFSVEWIGFGGRKEGKVVKLRIS
jgi:hypothetical protein